MERKKRGERRRERDEEFMRERDRERRGSETDVPKLYTYNEYEHSVYSEYFHVMVTTPKLY